MDLTVAIARSVPEMYGEVDQRFSALGVTCTSINPTDIMSLAWFEHGPFPDLLFLPLSCLDNEPDAQWMKTFQDAAAERGTHVAWVMSENERTAHQKNLETVLTVQDLRAYIDALKDQFGLQTRIEEVPNLETINHEKSEGSGLFGKVKKWAESVVGGSEPSRHPSIELGPPEPLEPVRSDSTKVERRPMPPRPKPRGDVERENVNQSNDVEVLRDYLRLKEEEIRDLRHHIDLFEDENQKLFKELDYTRNEKAILDRKVDTLRGRLLFLEEENEKLRREKKDELDALRSEYKNKMDRLSLSEDKLREQELKFEDLRERVRNDLFSVQERERYLEARIEILKRDTEILLHQKDEKILELLEQVKQLKFKNEAIVDTLNKHKELDREEEDRSERIVRALKLATSLLDSEREKGSNGDIRKRKA